MSPRDGSAGGVILFLIFVLFIAYWVFLAVAAGLALVAFAYSVLALIAWKRPLRLGKLTVEPHQARAFIARGVLGAIIFPAFLLFCQSVFDLAVNWTFWKHFAFGGYVLGSICIEFWLPAPGPSRDLTVYTPPVMDLLPPQRPQSEKPSALSPPPFQYARWDDEGNQP